MALFYVSSRERQASRIRDDWKGLYGNANIAMLADTLHLVTSAAFRPEPVTELKRDDIAIWGFGTLFNENGFGQKALEKLLDSYTPEELSPDLLFGHFILLIWNGDTLRILTDEVGVLNVFYTHPDRDFTISNSYFDIHNTAESSTPSPLGISEFMLKGSFIAAECPSSQIYRLPPHTECKASAQSLTLNQIEPAPPAKMTYHEYLNAIVSYFELLRSYPGKVTSELSAGHDSRLVGACAHQALEDIEFIGNDNQFDLGVDEFISQRVAQALNRPFRLLRRTELQHEPTRPITDEVASNLRITNCCRDPLIMKVFSPMARLKFKEPTLLLGGYGGETVRAKYSRYSGYEGFALDYYNLRTLRSLSRKGAGLADMAVESLYATYQYDWANSNPQVSQMLYTMDRMRIWGGARIFGYQHFGHYLHPFLDWKLLSPIFAMDMADIDQGLLLKKLLKDFAPSLASIPINPNPDECFAADRGRPVRPGKITRIRSNLAKRLFPPRHGSRQSYRTIRQSVGLSEAAIRLGLKEEQRGLLDSMALLLDTRNHTGIFTNNS